MGRPRRPFNGVEEITTIPPVWTYAKGSVGSREEKRWSKWDNAVWKNINGIYDPLTYLHVLSALAAINPDIELRAANLAKHMAREFPLFIWDAITIGKVLADLADTFEDALGRKNGLLERGRDYRGSFYLVHHYPDILPVYKAMRNDLIKMVEAEMVQRDLGKKPQRLMSPLLDLESVKEVLQRSAEAI